MEQQTFSSLFKDLISRLYDRVAIETHPLAAFFPVPEAAFARRAEVIQQLILDEIGQLRPEGKEILQSPEWRPYLILQKRYIEGQDPHKIAQSLYIGDRQFRRDHSRALQALSLRVWQRYFQPADLPSGVESTDLFEEQASYELHAEQLELNEVIQGVISLIARRLEIENIQLESGTLTCSIAGNHRSDPAAANPVELAQLRSAPGRAIQVDLADRNGPDHVDLHSL